MTCTIYILTAKFISHDLNVNLCNIKTLFGKADDVVIREFRLGLKKAAAFLVMLDGLVDTNIANEAVMKSLMYDNNKEYNQNYDSNDDVFLSIKESILSITNVQEINNLDDVIELILSGSAVLFINGSEKALGLLIQGWEARGVQEPATEVVVRGPREGFVETLSTNITLVRRKIKNVNLQFETLRIGRQTKTDICITYIKGIVNNEFVKEVKSRVEKIEIDSILESGYIEAFIEDNPSSIFPSVGNSEKPDVVAAKILEGRVAIFVDGTPFVLTIPYLFVEAFQTSEDYYSRPYYTTFIRLLRWFAFALSVLLPGLYVAITTFHQELLPSILITTVAAAIEGTPFPAGVEAFIMQIIYEVLREAGVRLPRPVGQAVSIVGALVIGEAAVSAGLIGAPMVIIVATTAIASFVVPPLGDANALMRLLFIILASFSGLYGIMLGIGVILIHLCSIRSLGVPYTSPLSSISYSDLKDAFIRVPLWAMLTRPRALRPQNIARQEINQKPKPPKNDS